MKKFPRLMVLLAILIASLSFPAFSSADDSTVAPFIDAKIDSVSHVSLSRLDFDAVTTWWRATLNNSKLDKDATDQLKQDGDIAIGTVSEVFTSLKKSGAKDYYTTFADNPATSTAFATIVPLGPDPDVAAMTDMLAPDSPDKSAVIGNTLIISSPKQLEIFKAAAAKPNPDLMTALAVNPDAQLHVAFLPSAIHFLDLMVGNGNADDSVFAKSDAIKWIAVTVALPPKASISAVIQCNTATDAANLVVVINRQINYIKQKPEAQKSFGDQLALFTAALKPTVDGSKISITLNQDLLAATLPRAVHEQEDLSSILFSPRRKPDDALSKTAPDIDKLKPLLDDNARKSATPPLFASTPKAKSICFICDGSGSLVGGKDEALRVELKKAVSQLKPDQSFNVFIFQEGPNNKLFYSLDTDLVKATPDNIAKINDLIDNKLTFHGETNPVPALEQAWRENPEMIYLVTDGEFDEPDTATVMAKIKELNDARKNKDQPLVKVNTVLLVEKKTESYPDFEKQMKDATTDTGGKYTKAAVEDLLPP